MGSSFVCLFSCSSMLARRVCHGLLGGTGVKVGIRRSGMASGAPDYCHSAMNTLVSPISTAPRLLENARKRPSGLK